MTSAGGCFTKRISSAGPGWRFIEHRVDITEFMVRLELACRARNDLHLIERKDIVENSPKTRRDRRVRLMAKVRPDGAAINAVGRSRRSLRLAFWHRERQVISCWSCDRGEMPIIRRKSKEQTYYAKKMLTYYEANRVGEHVRELGIPNFRVATVTTTPSASHK